MLSLLTRLESAPTATFPEQLLVREFKEEFEALRSLGLLMLEELPHGSFTREREGTSYIVKRDGDHYIGVEAGEAEPEIVELDDSEVRRWCVDLLALVRHLHRMNELAGRPECVSERLWFLGERHDGEALLLGLYSEPATLEDQLSALPTRFPSTYSSFKVFCPSYEAPPSALGRLESHGVRVLKLDLASPFELPFPEESESSQPVFTPAPDYRSVKLRDREFILSPQRAKVVKILHRAHRNGHVQLPWTDIQTQLRAGPDSFYADRMQDVFKGLAGWTELIKRPARGYYAINL